MFPLALLGGNEGKLDIVCSNYLIIRSRAEHTSAYLGESLTYLP